MRDNPCIIIPDSLVTGIDYQGNDHKETWYTKNNRVEAENDTRITHVLIKE